MYKVINVFRDKYTKKLYAIGDSFTSNDQKRTSDLINRRLIEGVSVEDTPSTINFESMTKNNLVKLLVQREIEFNKRQSKDELIKLLQGGE